MEEFLKELITCLGIGVLLGVGLVFWVERR